MLLTTRPGAAKTPPQGEGKMPSHGLEWLWQQLRDVRQPHIVDCGPVRQNTLDVLLRRGVKIYVADLISPLQRGNPKLWEKSKKGPVFLTEVFLEQIPNIPQGSQDGVFCWNLLDLLPAQAVVPAVEHLFSLLKPDGVFFAILRQPYLADGADSVCWIDGLTFINTDPEGKKPFAYPVITNRQMENMFPAGSVKIFLTRSGRREVVALK